MTALQQKKIDEIHFVSDNIPGVIIIHDAITLKVAYMSQRGLDILKVTLEDLDSIGTEYYLKYFNEDDMNTYFPVFLDLIEQNDPNKVITYFQQVRADEDSPWVWYLTVTKILLQEDKQASLTITIAQPVTELRNITNKLDRLMEEHMFLKGNLTKLSVLSKREKEVLSLLAVGKTSEEISKELFISVNTAKTHRKKIKEKLDASTTIELHKFANAFNLV